MHLNKSSAQIISDLGCNVNSLILNNQNIIDGNTNEEKLASNYLAKSALLTPFPNRINKGRYVFKGKEYQLPINKSDEGHSIHGLVFNKKFVLISTTISDTSISASFFHEIKNIDFTGYPFNLSLIVKCILEEKKFTIQVSATNKDTTTIPYGIGWHPYLKANKKIDNCSMSIPGRYVLEIDKKNVMIPTGKSKPTQQFKNILVGKKIFDTCFTNLVSYKTQFENIIIFQDSTMNYLQIYTPSGRQSIAVEPMSCAPDAFNNKMGLISLAPLTRVTHSFGIKVNL